MLRLIFSYTRETWPNIIYTLPLGNRTLAEPVPSLYPPPPQHSHSRGSVSLYLPLPTLTPCLFSLPVPMSISSCSPFAGVHCVHILHSHTEDEEVFLSGLLGHLHIGSIHGANGKSTVQHELHVTSARGLGASCRDLLRQVSRGDGWEGTRSVREMISVGKNRKRGKREKERWMEGGREGYSTRGEHCRLRTRVNYTYQTLLLVRRYNNRDPWGYGLVGHLSQPG